jgi:delta24-sterol reductase
MYNVLRQKYKATSLPSIQDKVKDRGRREIDSKGLTGMLKKFVKSDVFLCGLYELYKAIISGDYILGKQKAH